MSASTTRSTRRRATELALLALVWLAASTSLARPAFAAQSPVGLGTADSFAVLAGSGITNTGLTTIDGDVGTFPTLSETGFASMALHGTDHGGDAVTQAAKKDLVAAYGDVVGRNPVTKVAGELGGTTLPAGVYASATFGLSGVLTLDAKGDSGAAFIFQAGSTVTAEVNGRILLRNGANPCNVTWQVGSSATFKSGARFVGDVLARASITAQAGAAFEGRLLAGDGAVTLDSNTITNAHCPVPDVLPSGGGVAAPVATTEPSGQVPAAPVLRRVTKPSGAAASVSPTADAGSPAIGAGSSTGTTGLTAVDAAAPRWALMDPSENLSTPSTPRALAVVGAPTKGLMRTAFTLLAASAVGSVILVARRRRRATLLA